MHVTYWIFTKLEAYCDVKQSTGFRNYKRHILCKISYKYTWQQHIEQEKRNTKFLKLLIRIANQSTSQTIKKITASYECIKIGMKKVENKMNNVFYMTRFIHRSPN